MIRNASLLEYVWNLVFFVIMIRRDLLFIFLKNHLLKNYLESTLIFVLF